jgi:hypothetical protein
MLNSFFSSVVQSISDKDALNYVMLESEHNYKDNADDFYEVNNELKPVFLRPYDLLGLFH